jgi:hypothetical protein
MRLAKAVGVVAGLVVGSLIVAYGAIWVIDRLVTCCR